MIRAAISRAWHTSYGDSQVVVSVETDTNYSPDVAQDLVRRVTEALDEYLTEEVEDGESGDEVGAASDE